MTGGDAGTAPQPTRILEHTLIDICDLLGATFALDGATVVFVRRSGGSRQEWRARLGDWLVADGPSWRVVADAEFGQIRAEAAKESTTPLPRAAAQPVPPRPSALAT